MPRSWKRFILTTSQKTSEKISFGLTSLRIPFHWVKINNEVDRAKSNFIK